MCVCARVCVGGGEVKGRDDDAATSHAHPVRPPALRPHPHQFEAHPLYPTVLVAWVHGHEAARAMHTRSDDEVMTDCAELLKRFCGAELLAGLEGGAGLPRPRRVVRSGWLADPWVRGSYSFVAVGGDPTLIDEVARPLEAAGCRADAAEGGGGAVGGAVATPIPIPRVCFAGEHTHRLFYSTMHAAYLTGEREGRRVASAIKRHVYMHAHARSTCARLPT